MDKRSKGRKTPGAMVPTMPGELFDIDIALREHCPEPGGVLVLSFPTPGQAGVIAAKFLVRTLDLEDAGGVYGSGFGPVAEVQDGRFVPLVRAHCKALDCKPGTGCKGLTALTSELNVAPPLQLHLARALREWVEANDIGLTVVLEGVKLPGAEEPLFGAASNDETEAMLGEHGIPPLQTGVIGGVGAALLAEMTRRGQPAVGLFAPTASDSTGDTGAAGHLLDGVNRLLVDVRIDPEPLMEESQRVQQAQSSVAELPLYT